MSNSDAESDWESPTHELYPFANEFRCAGIFRKDFVERKIKVRDCRGGILDDVAIDLLRDHIHFLNAVTCAFPANWPEDLRLRYDPAIPKSERMGEPRHHELGRLAHHMRLDEIYRDALKRMQSADADFQSHKVAARQNDLITDSDVDWITETLDEHHEWYQQFLLKQKNQEVLVMWLRQEGETASLDKEKMRAMWHEYQAQQAQPSSGIDIPKAPPKKKGFFQKLFK